MPFGLQIWSRSLQYASSFRLGWKDEGSPLRGID